MEEYKKFHGADYPEDLKNEIINLILDRQLSYAEICDMLIYGVLNDIECRVRIKR